jgi:hypothetical protein
VGARQQAAVQQQQHLRQLPAVSGAAATACEAAARSWPLQKVKQQVHVLRQT